MAPKMLVKIRVPEIFSCDSDQYAYNGLTGYIFDGNYTTFINSDRDNRVRIELTEKSKEKMKKYNKENFCEYRFDPAIYKKYLVIIERSVVISNE